jgi:hypothetical protein
MRLLVLLALFALAGCSGSVWTGCDVLAIYEPKSPDFANIRLVRARYRIKGTDPLTVEYDGYDEYAGLDKKRRGVIVAHHVKCD